MKESKDVTLTIRLTKSERALIERAAQQEERSAGSLVRRVVLAQLSKPSKSTKRPL